MHLQGLVDFYGLPDTRELRDAIAVIENAMRAPANFAERRAAANGLTEISARLTEISTRLGAPPRAEEEHRRAEYRRNRQVKRVDHEGAKRAAAEQQARLAAIRQGAIAQAELEERERAQRRAAEKEARRIEAERRAAERAEREAARLAQWPRRALARAS